MASPIGSKREIKIFVLYLMDNIHYPLEFTAINDTEITGRNDLSKAVSDSRPGDVLKFTVYRKGQSLEISVTVGEQIQSATQEQTQMQGFFGRG